MLDLGALGFDIEPEATGRPGYHPATMLKIYVYGYLSQVQSSRRLERECARNLELIWLTGQLKPDFKTIADFRKDNGPAIKKVCRQFVAFCRDIDLLDASIVAIDGSKFKAVNAKARSYTREKLSRRLGEIDTAIERYMAELDRADEVAAKTGMLPPDARLARTIKKLVHYRKEAGTLRGQGHARWHALEQGNSGVVLQLPDRGGDGGLGDVEGDCRLAHLAGIRRGDEIADLLQGERHLVFRYRDADFPILQ
jgi:transposase